MKHCKTCSCMIENNPSVISRKLRLNQILLEAAAFFNINEKELIGKCRKRELVHARNVIVRNLKEKKYTLKEIGYLLGGRDHTTVMHSLISLQNLMDTDCFYKIEYEDFCKRIDNSKHIMHSIDRLAC